MSFDGFYMAHINKELKHLIVNGRVTKIHQPNDLELVFTIRSHGKNNKLLINISADSARYQLTTAQFLNPDVPTNFCMVLRKYLEGAVLLDIQQLGLDRISTFVFQRLTELGDTQIIHLSVEIMGKHSNVTAIFPETNKIIDCMKHIPPSKNTYRTLLPNATYLLPPQQHKLNIFNTTPLKITSVLDNDATINTVQHHFQGFSQPFITALKQHAQDNHLVLSDCLIALQQWQTAPIVTPSTFFAVNVAKGKSFDTLSESLDYFYAIKAEKDRIKQAFHFLFQRVSSLIAKDEQKLQNITSDLTQAEHADIYRIKGELLMAYHYTINRGQTSVTLDNFYDNNKPITITLKPEKNATQNAKDYFKKYQKLKQSYAILNEQLQKTTEELHYLDSVLVQLNHASLQDLDAIKLELINTGYIKAPAKVKKQPKLNAANPLVYIATDGTKILVGRNNLQNDQLTLKTAKKDHIWLHTKNIPGSHVIIQSSHPTDATLFEAAMITAYHSKFQQSANVPVDYVPVNRVKKPNGSKPGFVIYDSQKTIVVTPDEQIVLSLKQEKGE